MLVSCQVSPQPPPLKVLIPGRLISVDIQLSPELNFPPTTICSFYGSNVTAERATFAPHLQTLLRENVVLMGDFNATTQDTDASTLTSNHWNQLRAWEICGQLLDSVRMLTPLPPFTRTRRYGGTKRYIDRIYFTQVAAQFLVPSVPNMSECSFFSDHDLIVVICQPWNFRTAPVNRCSLWNHKELRQFNSLLSLRFHPPTAPQSLPEATATYEHLSFCIRECMAEINSHRPARIHQAHSTSWDDTVRLLLRQAHKRSKVFFRRIKAAYFTPPPPSLLPPSNRSI